MIHSVGTNLQQDSRKEWEIAVGLSRNPADFHLWSALFRAPTRNETDLDGLAKYLTASLASIFHRTDRSP